MRKRPVTPISSHASKRRGFWSALKRDERGVSAVFFALMLLGLVAALGVALDSALAFNLKARLQKAIDSAGLAAGRVAYTDHAVTDARAYFDANFPPGFLASTVTSFDVVFDDDKTNVTVNATATMPTRFMKIFGKPTTTVAASTVIHRDNEGLELALVLDVTGSMISGNHIGGLRDAATDLINILFGQNETNNALWVSLVPYASMVNIGTQHKDWIDPADDVYVNPGKWGTNAWFGCVRAQAMPYAADDTLPGTQPGGRYLKSFFYAPDSDNKWGPDWTTGSNVPIAVDQTWQSQNSAHGPNLGCGPAITELQSSKTNLLAAIANLNAWSRGGTTGNDGLAWGWRTISPSWRGLWGGNTPSNYPLDYNSPGMTKAIVLLTDGQNQYYQWPITPTSPTPTIKPTKTGGALTATCSGGNCYGPKGSDDSGNGRLGDFAVTLGQTYPSFDINDARDELDRREALTCAALKLQGVVIYSIIFGGADAQAQTLFQNCASAPGNYFNSPDNATLADAFHQIGQQLSKLRVAQ